MEPIRIVTATNENYAVHLGVMLVSLLAHRDPAVPVHIRILHGNLSELTKRKLKSAADKPNTDLQYIEVNDPKFDDFKETRYITKEMYYRISIPDLLDKDITKVLYLDCDLVVKEDLSKLWNTDIGGYYVAAVESAYAFERLGDLRISKADSYFNSGVLLMNLNKWRNDRISAQVIDFIQKNPHKLVHPDQDALNAVLHKNWLKLDPKWNFTTGHIERLKLKLKPAVIHFTGKRKPWNSRHPLAKEYVEYRNRLKW